MRMMDQSITNYAIHMHRVRPPKIHSMPSLTLPCVLMRAGTSRGPFFLRDWLPADEQQRDEALIGAIGASDLLQVDGVGGGSTLTSKVAIVSRSTRAGLRRGLPVRAGRRRPASRSTRGPTAATCCRAWRRSRSSRAWSRRSDGETTVRVFNVNTRSRIDVTVLTPGRRVTYDGTTRIDGVAGTAAPIRLNFLDAWGAVTGSLFPTGQRIDIIDGLAVTCIDAAMPLVIVRAADLGLTGREAPGRTRRRPRRCCARLETLRRAAGERMGLGDVSDQRHPQAGDRQRAATTNTASPRATSRPALPRLACGHRRDRRGHRLRAARHRGQRAQRAEPACRRVSVLHPQGRIDVEVAIEGHGDDARIERASLVRTARKILQGDLHIPEYVFSQPPTPSKETSP